MNAVSATMELVDIIDMQPIPGEYAACRETSEFTEFGHTVTAFHRYHAQRSVISKHWQCACEMCNHGIRWAVVMQDADGGYHVYGHDCAGKASYGKEEAYKLRIASNIKEIETKRGKRYVWGCPVPAQYWDIAKENRPDFVSMSKLPAIGRGRKQMVWRLTVWGRNAGRDAKECSHSARNCCGPGVTQFTPRAGFPGPSFPIPKESDNENHDLRNRPHHRRRRQLGHRP